MAKSSSRPVIAVASLTEAFEAIWPGLVEEAGAELVACDLERVREATTGAPLAGVVVAAGGAEETLPAAIAGLGELPDAAEVVAVGAEADHRLAVEALHHGAHNFFALPSDLPALRAWLASRARRARADALESSDNAAFGRLLGRSASLRAVIDRARRILATDLPVLITGETGTGKELMAEALHREGPRARAPFIEINCAALPASLLESELFGAEKGAYTGATGTKVGLVEAADGGTLFLDEIGEMPLEVQAKLLRLFEDHRVRRLGATRSREVDVRIVAATHVDLHARAREGKFRQDLLYRLDIVPLRLPPLRDRGDDVHLLAEHFVRQVAARFHVAPPEITPAARDALARHPWPGNVRELAHAISRAVVLSEGALNVEALGLRPGAPLPGGLRLPWPTTMDGVEAAAAVEAVRRCEGNRSAAARLLGISRNRLRGLLGDAASEPGN